MRTIAPYLILILFQITLFSCRKSTSMKGVNVVNINLRSHVPTLDPAMSYDTISATVIYQSYETLFQYHYLKRPYTLIPLLAESMPKISADRLTYEFKIKPNIRYHDDPSFNGKIRTLKAVDFVNQIKRLAFVGTKSNGWFLFDDKIVGINEFREKAGRSLKKFEQLNIEGLFAKDEHTLIIKLIKPYPQLLHALAMSFTTPIPMEAIKHYDNNFSSAIVGTGPFKLKEYNANLRVRLEKFEHFHQELYPSAGDGHSYANNLLEDANKKLPFLEQLNFHVIKEEQTQWLEFLDNKIDILIIPKDHFTSALNDEGELSEQLKKKNISLQFAPSLTYWWLAFNMKDPVVGSNKYLRYAIAHAIDIDRFLKLFSNNTGQRAYSIYPPGIPGYDPISKLSFTYNLKIAKEYLKKAGFPEGKGLPVLKYETRSNNTTARQTAEFIKSELQKIGITVSIELNTFPRFLEKARSSRMQFWRGGWALDYPDSENIVQLLTKNSLPPGPNSSQFNNPKVNKLYSRLKTLENGPEKFQIMQEIETIVQNELPWIMLYYDRRYVLQYSHVKNYRYSPIIRNYGKYLKVGHLKK